MTATPMRIPRRPFAVEPVTGVMMPDGIFDAAIHEQRITCHYTNTGPTDLTDVELYLEGASDLGIIVTAQTHRFARIQAGAAVQVGWLANFAAASVGKKNVSFVARAAGHEIGRSIARIFVTRTTFDPATGTYTCEAPEGSINVKFDSVIGPDPSYYDDHCRNDEKRALGPWLPTEMTMAVTPNPAYDGQFGELPFEDPWWKVLGWIVAAVAAIVAIIAAVAGHGTAGFGVSGTFEETDPSVSCCSPDPGTTHDTTGHDTVAGVASIIATVGVAVGLADAKDPWRRGQEATPPAAAELTVAESVHAKFAYPVPPQAGAPFAVEVSWEYARTTSGSSYAHAVTEAVTNEHLLNHVEVQAPAQITNLEDEFIVRARFLRDARKPYAGSELYAYALLLAPGGSGFFLPLFDDGTRSDERANDGDYTGRFDLVRAYRQLLSGQQQVNGYWRVFIYAQDTNGAAAGMEPTEAATYIGGFPIASATKLSFDPTLPCPLTADASVLVAI